MKSKTYNTLIQFCHTEEVKQFFKNEARKARRKFPDYMRLTLEDLKTRIESESGSNGNVPHGGQSID